MSEFFRQSQDERHEEFDKHTCESGLLPPLSLPDIRICRQLFSDLSAAACCLINIQPGSDWAQSPGPRLPQHAQHTTSSRPAQLLSSPSEIMNNEVDLNAAGMLVSSSQSLSRINIDLISYQTKAKKDDTRCCCSVISNNTFRNHITRKMLKTNKSLAIMSSAAPCLSIIV